MRSGIPQGCCLSPTFFNLYTHGLDKSTGQADYLAYADDIAQIIPSHKSRHMHTLATTRAIQQIDSFENKWKIKTNKDKFTLINLGQQKTEDIRLADRTIQHRPDAVLGLAITKSGYCKHVKTRRDIASAQLTRLQRFRNLSGDNKRKLYLALVRSEILYPPIPMHTASTTQISTLQKVQNRATLLITNTTK